MNTAGQVTRLRVRTPSGRLYSIRAVSDGSGHWTFSPEDKKLMEDVREQWEKQDPGCSTIPEWLLQGLGLPTK